MVKVAVLFLLLAPKSWMLSLCLGWSNLRLRDGHTDYQKGRSCRKAASHFRPTIRFACFAAPLSPANKPARNNNVWASVIGHLVQLVRPLEAGSMWLIRGFCILFWQTPRVPFIEDRRAPVLRTRGLLMRNQAGLPTIFQRRGSSIGLGLFDSLLVSVDGF